MTKANKPMGTIDVSKIPDHAREILASWALDVTRDCFKRPSAEKEYAEWLKQYKKRQKNGD